MALVLALPLAFDGRAAAQSQSFEQRFGLARIAQFPPSELEVRPSGRDRFYRLGSVAMSPGARQGPRTWYVGRLHFAITFARLPEGSRVYVSAETRKRTFAQVEFTGAGSATRWSAYDLFLGETTRDVRGRTVEVVFHNYLQNKGVRLGQLPVRLHVEQFRAAVVERVVVYPDSAVETTRRLPTPLALRLEPLDGRPAAGGRFRVKVTLATKAPGDLLKHVSVEPAYDPDVVRLVEPEVPPQFASLRGRVARTFVFEALRAGRHQIGFAASSNINNPRAALAVNVDAREDGWFRSGRRWAGLGLLVAGFALVGGAVLRRYHTR